MRRSTQYLRQKKKAPPSLATASSIEKDGSGAARQLCNIGFLLREGTGRVSQSAGNISIFIATTFEFSEGDSGLFDLTLVLLVLLY